MRRALLVALGWLVFSGRVRADQPAPAAERAAAAQEAPAAEAPLPDLNAPEPDTSSLTPAGPRLEVYGFADFNYWHPLDDPSNPWLRLAPPYPTGSVGNLNLYFDTALSERVRSLVEVRFLYAPNGNTTINSDGTEAVTSTTLTDPAEFGRRIQWGGVLIERAWVEYAFAPLAVLRAGQFLTPFGIWNVDHGSPTLVGIRRPFVVHDGLYPERQTGLELHGGTDWHSLRLGYHATLSNGRGPTDTYKDLDRDKGVGGRVFVQRRGPFDMKVGASFYRGRYTDRRFQWFLTPGLPDRQQVSLRQYDELAVAFDARLEHRSFLLQSEFIYQERAYTNAGRSGVAAVPSSFWADGNRWGSYFLAGYRLPFASLMPYAIVEHYAPDPAGELTPVVGRIGRVLSSSFGLNFRPMPDLVLKLEFTHVGYGDYSPGSWGEHSTTVLQSQAAWAF